MDATLLTVALLLPWTVCFPFTYAIPDGTTLLAMKDAWKANLSSWIGDNPCQTGPLSWEGVLCDVNDRVVYLNLSKKGIVGTIPNEIANLEYLQHLDLSNPRNAKPPLNVITGDIPMLGGLTNLQTLNLSFNKITLDQFPTAVFSLTNLTALRIDNNFLSGTLPPELSRLTKLQYLYLGNNTLNGPLPPEFGNLVNLLEMSLWNNNLQSKIPSEFGKLVKLKYLNLHNCALYGGLPSELGNLTSLQNLTLYSNLLSGAIPDTWKKMINLKSMLLHINFLTKGFPQWIQDLPNLYNVTLDYNYFYGDVPDFTSSKLQAINIICDFFTGAFPKYPTSMIVNDTGNCFTDSDSNEKIKCLASSYFDCNAFVNSISNGNCPICPARQVIEDESTCVCTIPETDGNKSSRTPKLIGSIVGAGSFLILVILICWKWRRLTSSSSQDLWEGPEGVQRFFLQDLARVTNNFSSSHEIGKGGFGNVFYGILDNGKKVAIKRASSSSIQSSSVFRNEVLLLSRLHHRNLVHLIGFCEDDGIQILVYEYMPNGNLHTLLFKHDGELTLDWLKRLDIAIGIAQGVEYLHSFADPPVIHRDVKPSNILLDENLVAKLADFGISKTAPDFETEFATKPAGTLGYIDPQYILRHNLTTASDVYSFGVVLLELISGQKCIDHTREDDHNLVGWAISKMKATGVSWIVDPQLGDEYPKDVYEDMIRLAIDCASFNSEDRPSMKVVVTILDACRWKVSPQLPQDTREHDFHYEECKAEENYFASQSLVRAFANDTENSIADGTRSSFGVSYLSPR